MLRDFVQRSAGNEGLALESLLDWVQLFQWMVHLAWLDRLTGNYWLSRSVKWLNRFVVLVLASPAGQLIFLFHPFSMFWCVAEHGGLNFFWSLSACTSDWRDPSNDHFLKAPASPTWSQLESWIWLVLFQSFPLNLCKDHAPSLTISIRFGRAQTDVAWFIMILWIHVKACNALVHFRGSER